MIRRARPRERSLALAAALIAPAAACQGVLNLQHGAPAPIDGESGAAGAPDQHTAGGNAGTGSGGTKAGAGTTGGAGTTTAGRGGRPGSGGARTGGDGGRASGGAGGGGIAGGAGGGTGGAGNGGDTAAEAGDGGEAGEGILGECRTSEDCASVDPDCDMQCLATVSGKLCVAVAADRDHDLHTSAACAAAPGDDCDDTRAAVYPDAPELCDGLDNDCDDKPDMEDGLTISSQAFTLVADGASDADVAWSPPQQTWGVLWSSDETWYLPLNRSGNASIAPVPVSPNDTGGGSVSIAWGNDANGPGEFGLAYTVYPDVRFSTIATDGTWGLPDVPLTDTPDGWGSDEPDVVWVPSTGSWVTVWTDLRDNTFAPILRTVSTTGTFGPEVATDFGAYPRLATLGSRLALVWAGWPGSHGRSFTDTLVPDGSFAVAGEHDVESPQVAAGSDGFGVAARLLPDKVTFTELDSSGVVRCGPVLGDVGSFVPSAIVANGDRYAIFSATPSIRVLEVLPGCKLGQMVELDPDPARYVRVARATDGGLFVLWGGYDRPVETMLVGPHFCD